jgi:integrase
MAAAAPGRLMLDAAVGFSPHDVRRAFAAWAEDVAGFDDLEVKAVLDHSEGKAGDVTDRHYARSRRLHLKRPLLAAWTENVLEQVRRRRPEGRSEDLPACLSHRDAG